MLGVELSMYIVYCLVSLATLAAAALVLPVAVALALLELWLERRASLPLAAQEDL